MLESFSHKSHTYRLADMLLSLRIAKELFRELGKFGYSLTYRSGVNALRSINFHRELKKKKAFLKKDHWKKQMA
jgi:hypothetical protein